MLFPDYPVGPFTPPFEIGASAEGGPFVECQWSDGKIAKGLDLWWDSGGFCGVRVRYSDDSVSRVYGSAESDHQTWTMEPGERVTSATLWGDGRGLRCGRLMISTTNPSNTLNVGKNTDGQKSYAAPVGSGVLVGVVGRCGSWIDMLGMVFLNGAVTSVNISVDSYQPNLKDTSGGITQITLGEAPYYNNSKDKKSTYNFSNTISRTTSTTFTQTSATMYGVSVAVEVSASVFDIGVKETTTFQWQETKTKSWATTNTEETSMEWGLTGELEPGTGVLCTALAEQGLGKASYTATVTVTLDNGATSTYKEKGVFQNVVWTKPTTTVTDWIPPSGAPEVLNTASATLRPALELYEGSQLSSLVN